MFATPVLSNDGTTLFFGISCDGQAQCGGGGDTVYQFYALPLGGGPIDINNENDAYTNCAGLNVGISTSLYLEYVNPETYTLFGFV